VRVLTSLNRLQINFAVQVLYINMKIFCYNALLIAYNKNRITIRKICMNFNKIIYFSIVLFSTSSLLPSAPAPAAENCIHDEVLEFDEIPLVPKKYVLPCLKETQIYRRLSEYNEKELVKKAHFVERNTNCIWANLKNGKHYIEERKRQQATQEEIAELEQQINISRNLFYESDKEFYRSLDKMCRKCSTKLLINQRNMYWYQAVLLRSEKEELIQKQSAMQLKINQLESALAQQEPGSQQIEGMPNSLPLAPGGVK